MNEGFINREEIEHTIAAVASHTFSDTTAEDCENLNCAQESYYCKSYLSLLKQHFDEFRLNNCCNANENFLFWSSYIDIFHILRDHEFSYTKGDWELFKYAKKGYFVCNMTNRSTSGIGFDQALDKTYNYTSKASGGIIGFTREKKAVAPCGTF